MDVTFQSEFCAKTDLIGFISPCKLTLHVSSQWSPYGYPWYCLISFLVPFEWFKFQLLKIQLYFWLMFLSGCACTGKAGWAAPRLKDAALSLDKLREGYVEVCPYL